jgi:flagellar biosynthesis anti-sigma factor FlgM
MGISKIGSLFAANVDAIPASTPTAPAAPQAESQAVAPVVQNDAVVLSNSLRNMNRAPLADTDATRASRVQELKQQVRSGSYKPSSEKVAETIIRDLA